MDAGFKCDEQEKNSRDQIMDPKKTELIASIDGEIIDAFCADLTEIAKDQQECIESPLRTEIFYRISEFLKSAGDNIDVVVKGTNVVLAIFTCLRNSCSTSVCCNALYCLNCLLQLSRIARKKTLEGEIKVIEEGEEVVKTNLHILIKMLRGPSILPYACESLRILIEKEPDSIVHMVKEENIIGALLACEERQADPFKLTSVVCLLVKVIDNCKELVRPDMDQTIKLFLTCNHGYLFLVSASLQQFSLLLENYEGDPSVILRREIFDKLLFYSKESLKWDPRGSIFGRTIEVWNQVIARFEINEFILSNVYSLLDILNSILNEGVAIPCLSRVLFLVSNLALNHRIAEQMFRLEIVHKLLICPDDLTTKDKEIYYTMFCNEVITLGKKMIELDCFEEIFAGCLILAPNAFWDGFHTNFLKVILMLIDNELAEMIDMDDLYVYFEELEEKEHILSLETCELFAQIQSKLSDDDDGD